jgi:hypothetical protein
MDDWPLRFCVTRNDPLGAIQGDFSIVSAGQGTHHAEARGTHHG